MEPMELAEADQERTRVPAFWIILGIVAGAVLLYALWRLLNYYIAPGDDPTQRKDLVQAFAVIVGGLAAFGTLLIGWRNLRHQQRALLVNQRNTQEVENTRAQSSALQSYFEQMGDLLLDKDLRGSREDSEVRILAQAQTHTVLPTLNSERKGSVLIFLYKSNLLNASKPIVNLGGAALNGANLQGAYLQEGAYLQGAYLQEANLYRAKVTKERLDTARSLKGATMPDGS